MILLNIIVKFSDQKHKEMLCLPLPLPSLPQVIPEVTAWRLGCHRVQDTFPSGSPDHRRDQNGGLTNSNEKLKVMKEVSAERAVSPLPLINL